MHFKPKNVGAQIRSDGKCEFTVWAPLQHNVVLVVNDQEFGLEKDPFGYWSVTLPNVESGNRYFYRLDDDKLYPDPASLSQPEGVHKASAVETLDFEWNDKGWKGIPMSEMIIYELHVGTFSEEGDFNGVISKLPYLKDLGINTIELMPIAQFPGHRNWGYDGVFPFAVQDSYGGAHGLMTLVDAAHKEGIAIILDVVYNHLGPEGNYLGAYAPFFTEKYKTFWGSAINFDDAYCDGVRNYYWQNALMWLNDFHIDGLRLDAVHAIWDFGAKHFLSELSNKVSCLKEDGVEKVLIGECDLNDPKYIRPAKEGGYGLSGQWIDEFHHALHAQITGEVNGYYEDFGGLEPIMKAIKDSYVFTGQYSSHRKKNFGKYVGDLAYGNFVVFSQNHDQVGNRLLGDRLTKTLNFEQLKLAAAVVLLSPHVPMLFMGEEYAEERPFQYFISHTDKDLVQAVRNGRKEEFKHFDWDGEIPDPQSEATFNDCKLGWNIDDAASSLLLSYYKTLIAFRKKIKLSALQERNQLSVEQLSSGLLKVVFTTPEGKYTVLYNFNGKSAVFKEAENLIVQLNSSASQWGGVSNNLLTQNADGLLVAPYAVVVLTTQNLL